jgi:proline iminopeptidase
VSRGTWTAGRPRPVADLIDSTHVVHRYDQRGCGWSTGPDDYRLARAIADLDALRASWGHERWTVFGHSWGATLALAYAWTHPERTRAVVYCSGVGPGSAWRAPYRAESPRAAHSRPAEPLGRPRGPGSYVGGGDGLPPTLIVHGDRDPRPLANTRLLLDLIPDVRIAAIDAGHSPWVEVPGAVGAQLRAFLATNHV